jgi:hypothetical protein
MRVKTVRRFYCDFCSKGMFKKPSMREHEYACAMNPNRHCYLCEGQIDITGIITEFLKRDDVTAPDEGFKNGSTESEEAIKWLMEQVDYCPACALSVLRQGKIMAFEVFIYKNSVAAWRKEKSDEIRAACGF